MPMPPVVKAQGLTRLGPRSLTVTPIPHKILQLVIRLWRVFDSFSERVEFFWFQNEIPLVETRCLTLRLRCIAARGTPSLGHWLYFLHLLVQAPLPEQQQIRAAFLDF
jgi:hypothetical protein